jgi:hypothetical protein
MRVNCEGALNRHRIPFEAQGEETGRCQRFAQFEANGLTTEFTEVGTLRVGRLGELCWRNFVELPRVITGLGEPWELLDRI